ATAARLLPLPTVAAIFSASKAGGMPVTRTPPSRRRRSHGRIMHERIGVPSVETRSSWIIATVLLVILALSFGAPSIPIVALTLIAAESDGLRAVPALATSLGWLGFGSGRIALGSVASRLGGRSTVITGAIMICIGLALS